MNAKPTFPQAHPLSTIAASVVATLIAIGLLGTVAFLFQHDGKPLDRLVAAERACTQHVYVSERDSCVREWLAATVTANDR